MRKPDPRGIYFNSAHFGEPSYSYVCWLDVMGSANQMLRSLPIAANFVFKLHCAVLEAGEELTNREGLRLYPVMDGVYITSQRRTPLQALLNQAMRRVVYTFMNEEKPFHQFLVRGAIAFGPVYHGREISPKTCDILAEYEEVKNSVLIGLPMAQAYRAERNAPPFGIAAHSSARAFAPESDKPFRFMWLDWYRSSRPPVDAYALLCKLNSYFDWQKGHHNLTGYDKERILHHRQLAHEYFTTGGAPEQETPETSSSIVTMSDSSMPTTQQS